MTTSYLIFFVFVFFYPLFMAIYWMTGALVFFRRRERRGAKPPVLKEHPAVAVLVPCHNEEKCVHDALMQLSENNYPDFEIIAINDGSTDKTAEILHGLTNEISNLKVITLTENYGKAMALNAGVLATDAEFIMCIDADAILDKDALFWMLQHFINSPRVGAVTGNPRVINKTSLLSRIQIGEFSAIVGMVKRTQRNIGRLFTISGVNSCFRKSALHDVGYWSPDTVTEDIDISWKLQFRYWDIRYEPHALTRILVPETIVSLWRQRLRWAQGGFEAAIKYGGEMFRWKNRRMWIVGIEYWISVAWCYAVAFTLLCFAGTYALPVDVWPKALAVPSLIPGWTGVALALVCLLQFTVGLVLDSLYERRGLFVYLFWAIWYPAVYWILSAATTVVAIPKAIFKSKKARNGVWKSPVRQLRHAPLNLGKNKKEVDPENTYTFARIVPKTKRFVEVIIMFVSWSLWVYLITPLVSLLVWYAGGVLFVERMLTPGSLHTLQNISQYGVAIFSMWLALALWITWNKARYSDKRDRRRTRAPVVSHQQLVEHTGLSLNALGFMRESRELNLNFDDQNKPILTDVAQELRTANQAQV